MINLQNLSSSQLRKVVAIKEQIESLESELASLLGSPADAEVSAPAPAPARGRRVLSAAAKKRIADAQKRRWAKVHAAAGAAGAADAPVKRRRRKSNPALRAKLSAIAKARWAKAKAQGKSAL